MRVLRSVSVHVSPATRTLASRGRVESGDRAEDGRLAAARRPEDGEHFPGPTREPTSSGIGASCRSQTDRHSLATAAAYTGRQAGRNEERCHRRRPATRPPSSPAPRSSNACMRVVNRDAQRARLAGQVAADHEHDAELAQRVREGQDRAPSGAPVHASGTSMRRNRCHGVSPQHAAASTDVGRDGLESALDRLHRERQVGDDRREQQALERERERLTDSDWNAAPPPNARRTRRADRSPGQSAARRTAQ